MNDNTIDIKVVAKDLASATLAEIKKNSTSMSSSFEQGSKSIGMMEGAFQSLQRVGETALGFLSAQVIGRITDSISNFGKQALDGATKQEQLTIAFRTMLGSGTEAKKLMDKIAETARTTPFELPEVQTASKQLLAFGIGADDVIPAIRKLGDVASGIGAPLGDLAYLFGTIKTQGKAMTVDINQFANRGIPIWDELAKVTGKSGENLRLMVEEGKIGFPEINKAFDNMTASGGKFAGLMEAQSLSLEGIKSNISDTVNQMLITIVNDSGLFDIIKNGANDLLTFLSNNKDNIVSFFKNLVDQGVQLKDSIVKTFTDAKGTLEDWSKQLQIAGVDTGTFGTLVGNIFATLKDQIKTALGEQNVSGLKQAWTGLASFFGSEVANPIEQFLLQISRNLAQIRGDFTEAQRIDTELAQKQKDQAIGRVNYGAGSNAPRNFLANIDTPVPYASRADYYKYTNSLTDEQALKEARSRGYAYAQGGSFITSGPRAIIVGDNPGGKEQVDITPIGSENRNGPKGGTNIFNFYGYNTDEVANKINNQIKLGY